MGIKERGSDEKVFVFVGDMSFESGMFYEVHKYARNFDLPIVFVVEDNGVSTNTPTEATWNPSPTAQPIAAVANTVAAVVTPLVPESRV